MPKNPSTAAAVLIGLILSCSALSCTNDPVAVYDALEQVQTNVEKGKDVTMVYSEDGVVQLQLEAPTVVRLQGEEPTTEFPDGIKVTFFDPGLKPGSTLVAEYAIRDDKTQTVTVRDHVVVVNRQGDQLDTEELIWDAETRKIRSDAFVKIRTATEILYGTGFEADETFERYTILNPEGSLQVEEQP